MFYLINTQGTTTAIKTEPIYVGSVGVNNIVLFAPFPPNVQVSVSARLPNGIMLPNSYPLKAVAYPQDATVLKDIHGNQFTAFSGVIDESITSIPGLVQIQFKIILGIGKVLGTYTTSFDVVGDFLSEPISIPSDDYYIDKILQYLAEINSDPIKSIIYSSSRLYLALPTSVITDDTSISTNPSATVDNIGSDGYYIATTGRANLIFKYEVEKNIQLLQFWMLSPTENTINIHLVGSLVGEENGEETVEIKFDQWIYINHTMQSIEINPRAFLNGQAVNKIQITISAPQEQILVRGIQAFVENNEGKYTFTTNSGAQAEIPAPSISLIEKYYLGALDSVVKAQTSEQIAKESEISASAAAYAAQTHAANSAISASQASTYANNSAISASEAKEDADRAAESATLANNALQTILGKRRVYYEATMKLALGAIVNNTYVYASGDMFIIGEKNVPDLMLFSASDEPITTATQTITASQINSDTFTVVSGGRYKLENANGVIQWGVVAIESGVDTSNFITVEEFGAVIEGIYAAKQNKLPTTPSTVIGVNAMGEITNFKIAQAVPGVETDSDSIVNTAILAQALGDIKTTLTSIIDLQNSYINGGNT